MSAGQILLLVFILLIVFQTIAVFIKKRFAVSFMVFWLGLWSAAAFVVIYPGLLSGFSSFFGISRGVDLVIYFSIALIFLVIFRLYVNINRQNERITQLVRQIALVENRS